MMKPDLNQNPPTDINNASELLDSSQSQKTSPFKEGKEEISTPTNNNNINIDPVVIAFNAAQSGELELLEILLARASSSKELAEFEIQAKRNELIDSLIKSPQLLPSYLRQENLQAIKGLLQSASVDINSVDSNGNSFLHFAANMDSIRVAELLMRKGINTEIRNKLGRTYWEFAKYDCEKTFLDKIEKFTKDRQKFLDRVKQHLDNYEKIRESRKTSIFFQSIYAENYDGRGIELQRYREQLNNPLTLLDENHFMDFVMESSNTVKTGFFGRTALHGWLRRLVSDYRHAEVQNKNLELEALRNKILENLSNPRF